MWHYEHEPETRAAIDMIASDYFSRYEPGAFSPLRDMLLIGDHYMHLADLKSYIQAQESLGALYRDPGAWAQKGDPQHGELGKILCRPHHFTNHNRDLEGGTMSHTLERRPRTIPGEASVSPLAGKPAPPGRC